MRITINRNSGFCFGVVFAIQVAEEELEKSGELYCLGDIVHNNMEVDRLRAKGLKIIAPEDLKILHDCKVLIRAHGEPPETYRIALENNIELIDASCPVVLKLQNRIRNGFDEMTLKNGQIVIYGKEGHAEVNGLVGQIKGKAIIVNTEKDFDKIDYTRPVFFYSQTTQSTEGFQKMKDGILKRINNTGKAIEFIANDTICRQVSNRGPHIREFAEKHEVIVFVSGRKSSNGLYLYGVCKSENKKTYLISSRQELKKEWFEGIDSVGVCGATSTPMWLMEEIAGEIKKLT